MFSKTFEYAIRVMIYPVQEAKADNQVCCKQLVASAPVRQLNELLAKGLAHVGRE